MAVFLFWTRYAFEVQKEKDIFNMSLWCFSVYARESLVSFDFHFKSISSHNGGSVRRDLPSGIVSAAL